MFLYLISCGDYVKIGITKNVYRRLAHIQTGNPLQCSIEHAWVVNERLAPRMERQAHDLLKYLHVRLEWFKATPKFAKDCARSAILFIEQEQARVAELLGDDPVVIPFEPARSAGIRVIDAHTGRVE
jgi:hypothetical protein